MTDAHARNGILGAGLAWLLACAPGSAAGAAAGDRAAADIVRANHDWLPAMIACDGPRLARSYARNAIVVGADGDVLKGRAAIANFYRAHLNPCPHIVGGDIRITGSAKVGREIRYEWGVTRYVVLEPTGVRTTHGGPYLSIWKRDPKGRWLIVRNLAL